MYFAGKKIISKYSLSLIKGLGRFDTLKKSKYSDIIRVKEPEANSGNWQIKTFLESRDLKSTKTDFTLPKSFLRQNENLKRKFWLKGFVGWKRKCFNRKLSFNWDLLSARLKNHCKAWSYNKKKHKKIKTYWKAV